MPKLSLARIAPALIGLAAFVAACVVYSTADSAPPPAAPAPVSIALVDIADVLNRSDELKDRNELIKQKVPELENKLKETGDEIDRIENDLKLVIPPSDHAARVEKLSRLNELMAIHKARREAFQRQIDISKGDAITTVYQRAMATIDLFAKREGFDIVLVDDRSIRLPDLGSAVPGMVMQAVEGKRILYAREGVDITDRIVSLLNTEYASRRPSGGAQPAPAAPAPR